MCYIEKLEYKGFEVDLLYRFGRAKDYTLEIIPWLYIDNKESLINVFIGYQNITETEGLYFSKPIYNGTSILAVRPDSIRSQLPLNVLDANYNQKKKIYMNLKSILMELSKRKNVLYLIQFIMILFLLIVLYQIYLKMI